MPDKHEVGGSTPLEPTSRQCRQETGRETKRDQSGTEGKSQNRGKQREIEAEQREDEIPERRKRK